VAVFLLKKNSFPLISDNSGTIRVTYGAFYKTFFDSLIETTTVLERATLAPEQKLCEIGSRSRLPNTGIPPTVIKYLALLTIPF
jgi:hypothetical protein